MKQSIETNPEFASEIVLSVPYAYWLYKNNQLASITTSVGMRPFYFFCEDVIELYTTRTLDNLVALKDIPNKWIHNSSVGGGRHGVLDYSKWIAPPYQDHYKNNLFDYIKPFIIVNNIYNIEPGPYGFKPYRYFDIKNLYDIFSTLIEKGYNVIYKRPINNEFVMDQGELVTLNNNLKITASIEDIGTITDFDLCKFFGKKVININELQITHKLDYNNLQLSLFSEADGFVTVNGGGGILCAYFNKPVIMYVPKGKELRPMYLEHEDSYINKLSNAKIYPIFDNFENWVKNGGRDYNKLITTISNAF